MIKKIAVLGAGTMGMGIVQAFAMHGYDVNVMVRNTDKHNSFKTAIKENLKVFNEEGVISKEDIEKTLNHISIFSDLKNTVEDRDYIIESVPESLGLKQEIFKLIDEYCKESAILSSNTSSLKLSDITMHISEGRKKRVMLTHWYNPAYIMPIAELSFFGNMEKETYKQVETLYQSIGKQTVKVLKEVPGLVANRIQQGVAREVFSLIENGIASPEDIDKALKFGPAFRYATTGQLEVADFGGIDIWCIVGDNLLKEMDHSLKANALLRHKMKEGKLGIKTGEGFFSYEGSKKEEALSKYIRKLIHQLKASKYYE